MKRRHDRDEWLWERIDEDLMAMADERERLLMESEELRDVKAPEGMLENIHRELEIRNSAVRKLRIRRRIVVVLAAAVVSCVGVGLIGYGSRVYEPEILRAVKDDGLQTKVENTDSIYSEYDEEEVCQEIQKKLGVMPVRLGYQPKGTQLIGYDIEEKTNEVVEKYRVGDNVIHIYISKDYKESSINWQTDGGKLDTLVINSNGLEIEIYEYQDLQGQIYYIAPFEYLNTFYSIESIIGYDEFIKILENIIIENV